MENWSSIPSLVPSLSRQFWTNVFSVPCSFSPTRSGISVYFRWFETVEGPRCFLKALLVPEVLAPVIYAFLSSPFRLVSSRTRTGQKDGSERTRKENSFSSSSFSFSVGLFDSRINYWFSINTRYCRRGRWPARRLQTDVSFFIHFVSETRRAMNQPIQW